VDLTPAGITELQPLLESGEPLAQLDQISKQRLPRIALAEIKLCAPVERQEVWAAGVTYLRSKTARMEESDFSASAYDRVYEAERPELFFKCLGEKAAATGEPVGIRRDARWSAEFERADRGIYDRQRHEFPGHRGREFIVSAAGEDLRPFVRARSLDHSGQHGSRGARVENKPADQTERARRFHG